MMNYKILPAELRHIDGIEEIEKQCFSLPWSRENLINYLPSDSRFMLAAEADDGAVAGYVGLMYLFDEGYISNVAVSPEYRRQGIADRLIRGIVEFANENDLSFLTLEVRESNDAAIRLYSKNGFRKVGLGKNYYEKPRENAILMTKFLKQRDED